MVSGDTVMVRSIAMVKRIIMTLDHEHIAKYLSS